MKTMKSALQDYDAMQSDLCKYSGRTGPIHHLPWCRLHVPGKCCYVFTRLHGVITLQTETFRSNVVRCTYYMSHVSIMCHLGSEAATFCQYLDNSDHLTQNVIHPFQCSDDKVNSTQLQCLTTWQTLSAHRQNLPCTSKQYNATERLCRSNRHTA
jgi:hypothetical protein